MLASGRAQSWSEAKVMKDVFLQWNRIVHKDSEVARGGGQLSEACEGGRGISEYGIRG